MIPGEPYEVTIDLWATSHVFLPSRRLRVEIFSSNFPRFDLNLNIGGDQATGTSFETDQQTVLHTRGRRSSILLSAIPA